MDRLAILLLLRELLDGAYCIDPTDNSDYGANKFVSYDDLMKRIEKEIADLEPPKKP